MTAAPPLASPAARRANRWLIGAVIAAIAAAKFGYDLASEPRFTDESAYLSQAYYADLLISRAWNDRAWIEYPAIDLPPLPKYLIGLSLRAAGHRRPGRAAARHWYQARGAIVGSASDLWVARWPSVILGGIGCAALYALGTIAGDRRAGIVAAALVMLDPLYAVHARRAMSDVPCESFTLLAAALGLWGWRRTLAGEGGWLGRLVAGIGAGVCAGLAVLSKLSGGLAVMILAAWMLWGVLLPGFRVNRKVLLLVQALIAGISAFATFAAFNPFLWSHPPGPLSSELRERVQQGILGRTTEVIRFRGDVYRDSKNLFPDDALYSLGSKFATVAVQGFGRFGPLGPRRLSSQLRYDWVKDRGALLWWPLVAAGGCLLMIRGKRELRDRMPPTSWALLAQWIVAMATVTAFIPLAWDRYMLPIEAISALLGATAIVAGFDFFVAALVRPSREPNST
jgi:4-amino-4-deoxy-L-arabinose transferase-like glycosyltransferase